MRDMTASCETWLDHSMLRATITIEIQPIPREMRLEMLIGMEIGIVNAKSMSLFESIVSKETCNLYSRF